MFDILVRNFQCVKEAKIRVDGLTIMRGSSSAGKSSIMKAVYGAMQNKISPLQPNRLDPSCLVALRFEGAQGTVFKVSRKGSQSPVMCLGTQEYQKLGGKVPSEVETFLNLGFLDTSGDDKFCLNYSPQFQKPLLLSYSQKRIADILSSSSVISDFNDVWLALQGKRTELYGAFMRVDSMLSEGKDESSKLESWLTDAKPIALKVRDQLDARASLLIRKDQVSKIYGLLTQVYVVRNRMHLYAVALDTASVVSGISKRHELCTSLRKCMHAREHVLTRMGMCLTALEHVDSIQSMQRRCAMVQKLVSLRSAIQVIANRSSLVCDALMAANKVLSGYRVSAELRNVCIGSTELGSLSSRIKLFDAAVGFCDMLLVWQKQRSIMLDILRSQEELSVLRVKITNTEKLLNEDVCPVCGNNLNSDSCMSIDEVEALRSKLDASLQADRRREAVLVSQIEEAAKGFDFELSDVRLTEEIQKCEAQIAEAESELQSLLTQIKALEQSDPSSLSV